MILQRVHAGMMCGARRWLVCLRDRCTGAVAIAGGRNMEQARQRVIKKLKNHRGRGRTTKE